MSSRDAAYSPVAGTAVRGVASREKHPASWMISSDAAYSSEVCAMLSGSRQGETNTCCGAELAKRVPNCMGAELITNQLEFM